METDPELLESKAKGALQRYGHSMVIGNILTTRKRHVVIYTPKSQTDITISDKELEQGLEIESRLIPELIHRHEQWK